MAMSTTNQPKKPVPNPGTAEALAKGCICPVLDNSYGKGYMGQPGVYVYTVGCKVHPLTVKESKK